MKTSANRYHDIDCGHRVVGHESKCKNLHGHTYRWHFSIEGDSLDSVGRVIDFGVIKSKLCSWLEENYDHKFLLWEKDPLWEIINLKMSVNDALSFVEVPFNPTAENIAEHFIQNVAPKLLKGTGCVLTELKIEETRKCSVTVKI